MPSTYETFKLAVRGSKELTSEQEKESKTDYVLDIYTAQSIPPADFEACLALIELTSSRAYDASSGGWSPTKKRKEMKLPDMRYLIARRGSRDAAPETSAEAQGEMILGFLSFMVTYENGKEVIYCYEIHLSPSAQGLGLGGLLMRTLEDIGSRVGLEKAMLTVFKSNSKALRSYERLGFGVDEYSPQPRRLRNGRVKEADYLILSKTFNETPQDYSGQ